jgi:hypothetical protein
LTPWEEAIFGVTYQTARRARLAGPAPIAVQSILGLTEGAALPFRASRLEITMRRGSASGDLSSAGDR